jgi:nucleotide-binding universal stress UspA family protein
MKPWMTCLVSNSPLCTSRVMDRSTIRSNARHIDPSEFMHLGSWSGHRHWLATVRDLGPYRGTWQWEDDARMVSSATGESSSSTGWGTRPAPIAVDPIGLRHVVVPLDGSPFAERALPVAGWLAAATGGDVQLVGVVPAGDDEGAENATRYLDSACRHHHATSWDLVRQDDVGDALAAAVGRSGDRLACLATHGRGRSATVGSVAVSLVERSTRPVMLVGPAARVATAVDAPLIVAVDGTPHDDVLVGVALGWAARLARRLDIVTVAEPACREGESPGGHPSRDIGDLERYVDSLADRAQGCGVAIGTRVVRDAVHVAGGLVPVLDGPLVVLGSRPRPGVGPMAPGSRAASIVHDAAVPALVVPVPSAG